MPDPDPPIAPDDGMFVRHVPHPEALAHYRESGRTALRCVRAAVAAAGTAAVRRVLDLPCGHGRILRVLKAAYPDAALTACDIDRAGVDFCAATFGAEPVYSVEDPTAIPVRGPFDLIWVGSLLTHLDAPRWPGFLARFRGLLSADGVCVVTTHGDRAAALARDGHTTYGLADPRGLVRRYDRRGFAYHPYRRGADYGISLSSVGWVVDQVRTLPDTRLVLLTERGWHDHQDVVAFGPAAVPARAAV